MTTEDPHTYLVSRLSAQQLSQGLHAIRDLHARIRALLDGGLTRVLDHDDYGQAGWFIHLKTPALCEIARQGWVERHLHDYSLLAESPILGECCRTTVVELFGVEAFHVAVQHYPVSDGLVQGLCHHPSDKVDQIRRITGQLINLRLANGSYPPPGIGPDNVSSVDRPAVDAIPVG